MHDGLRKVAQMLAETPMCFMATLNGGQPRVRAFQYQFEQDDISPLSTLPTAHMQLTASQALRPKKVPFNLLFSLR